MEVLENHIYEILKKGEFTRKELKPLCKNIDQSAIDFCVKKLLNKKKIIKIIKKGKIIFHAKLDIKLDKNKK